MMNLIRTFVWVMLLALLASPAAGQVVSGTTFYFDHTADETAASTAYQLCVGGTDCREVAVIRQGTTDTLTFTLPAWVPRGRRDLTVRAVWKAPLSGTSAPSNILSQVVVGGPERLRTTPTVVP